MQKQVVTVTLNPCIDKTMILNGFTYGGMNRAVSVRTDFSGKAMNVSRVLKNLGYETICLGLNYTEGGQMLERELDADGVPHDFISVEGALRTNIKLVEPSGGTMTEVNESGGYVNEHYITKLMEKIKSHVNDTAIIVLSGSAPKGVPKDIYRKIIEMIKKSDISGKIKIILDAEGELLLEGLRAAPYAVKPNLYELETAFNLKLNSREDIIASCTRVISSGVSLVCVSMGSEGALITDGQSIHCRPAPPVTVKGVTGAGDSMVAGLCAAIMENLPVDEILKYGMAAAGGAVMREGTLLCEADGFKKVLGML